MLSLKCFPRAQPGPALPFAGKAPGPWGREAGAAAPATPRAAGLQEEEEEEATSH